MKEEWRDIKGYEGIYQVSNLGRVRSLDRKMPFNVVNGKVVTRFHKGVVLAGALDKKNGYISIHLYKEGHDWSTRPHRLVAEAFLDKPNIDGKLEVNHINGIKTDNRAENLEWTNRLGNMKHASETGLVNKGEKSSNSKISRKKALAIIHELENSSDSIKQIAIKLNVSESTIHHIKKGGTWKHLSDKIKRNEDATQWYDKEDIIKVVDLLRNTSIPSKQIAKITGVSYSVVTNVLRGYTHKELTGGKIKRPDGVRRVLTDDEVKQIIELLKTTTMFQIEIADQLGVTKGQVGGIQSGRYHKHITGGKIQRPEEYNAYKKLWEKRKSGSQNK